MPIFDEWRFEPAPDDVALPVANTALRSILIRRGIVDAEAFRRFVAPAIEDLHDPAAIHGMDFACERIARAIRDHEAIVIYGDYDVDGVTSIVLLQTVLRALGADVSFVVPHRLVDGYGLKTEVLERVLAEKNVRLVITVDCGITSVEPVRRALDRGIDVIITDHHLPPGVLPAAAAVLNPKQPGCTYPFKDLAGVGVAFKLCCELIRRAGKKMSIDSLLKIAAIGTIADVAPLTGENRTIAWLGLRGLADVRNAGLRALLKRLGIYGRTLRASDIGFKVGPRINAAGRLASANTAIDLFAATDDDAAWQLCAELDRMNAERRDVELRVRTEAEEGVDADARILILADEQWHKGVLGLTAGRIAQKFHRPVLMIAIEGERCVGSARSIPTINLHAQLERVADLFEHFGGHDYACGFSFATDNLPALRERLARVFEELDASLFVRAARIDGELALHDIDREFVAAHEMLEPFGAANPQPLFAIRCVEVAGTRSFAEDCCEMTLASNGDRAAAIVWPSVKQLANEMVRDVRVDVLVQIEPDSYQPSGAKLILADARKSA
ncbi:MAG TPA: single-stranded-DNA-specific exonuclease RecJ [Thermoanaerobaculia bacterium]|nr:single-stranded-DNA-specific exonuclease RecJ [Thermoanaerobaculia bacterium]